MTDDQDRTLWELRTEADWLRDRIAQVRTDIARAEARTGAVTGETRAPARAVRARNGDLGDDRPDGDATTVPLV
jgi:hypothetical protein